MRKRVRMSGVALVALVALIALFTVSPLLVGRDRAEAAETRPAGDAALSWLALVDGGSFAESWRQAAELFRRQLTSEQWESAVRSAREPLGRVVSRRLERSEESHSLPGAPDGDYVVLQYDTSFEKKKSAVETVTAMKEKNGEWRVAGYFVR